MNSKMKMNPLTLTFYLLIISVLFQRTSGASAESDEYRDYAEQGGNMDLDEFELGPSTAITDNFEFEPFVKTKVKAKKTKCINHRIKGYYQKIDGTTTRIRGLPPSGTFPSPIPDNPPVGYDFVILPTGLTKCDLIEIADYTVDQINKYRSGELKFLDGTDDPDVLAAGPGGLSPLTHAYGNTRCSGEAAMGSLVNNYALGGGCAAAHAFSFTCPWKGAAAQNSCCARGHFSWGRWDTAQHLTKESVKGQVDNCLRAMWNEGIKDGQKGHWMTMKSPTYNYISIGIAWSAQGRVNMQQNFAKNLGGKWYCRKPGSKRWRFKQSNCELDCGTKTFRQTRCCKEDSGIQCKQNEIDPDETCKAPEPVC